MVFNNLPSCYRLCSFETVSSKLSFFGISGRGQQMAINFDNSNPMGIEGADLLPQTLQKY